jgi:hypothetical protein
MTPVVRFALLVLATTLCPSRVGAQAWLPGEGQGTVAVIYQNALVKDHLFSDGGRIDAGRIVSNNLLLDFGYGVTDRLALGVSLPFIASRYEGKSPHPASNLDDGRTHGTFQDIRVNVRYLAARGKVGLTPFVDVIIPSHRYDFYGHAAPGRRLAEVQFGVFVGHVLTRGLPGAFVQGRYSYGFSQRPLDRYHDRSNADVEVGYFINPRVRIFGLAASQYTHGGLEFTRQFPKDLTALEFVHHDQLARTNLVDFGGGVQVAITSSINLLGSYLTTGTGRSGHALNRGLSIGMSWSFGRSRGSEDLIGGGETNERLAKCLCQKSKGSD